MKTIFTILALGLAVSAAFAQDDNFRDDEIQTIFSKHKSNGGYGAFTLGYSQIDGKDAFVSGGRAGFILDHSFAFGVAGYGFVNNPEYHHFDEENIFRNGLAGGYGGIFVEPIIGGRMPVHLSFPILFGVGGIAEVENSEWWEDDDEFYDYESDAFLIFEPAAELEFNLTKFLRMAATASYRFTSDIEITDTPGDVLDGFMAGLTFKLGKF